MAGRWRDSAHLLRMAGLFGVGLGLFALVSTFMVPDGFGRFGHYRAGALDDNRAPAPVYGDSRDCAQCHDDVVAARTGSRHETIACQACHGPLAAHVADPSAAVPERPDPTRLCVSCHQQLAGRPSGFPQVEPAEHAGDEPCASCHRPHHPEPEGA